MVLLGDNVRNRCPQAEIPSEDSLPENLLARRYSSEKTYAGYVVGDFGIGDIVKGNAGVRIVKTDLFARSMIRSYVLDTDGKTVDGPIVPNAVSNSYTDVLPSFTLTGYITPNTLVRYAYAKAITSQRQGDL